jgi:hypothetical protein
MKTKAAFAPSASSISGYLLFGSGNSRPSTLCVVFEPSSRKPRRIESVLEGRRCLIGSEFYLGTKKSRPGEPDLDVIEKALLA